MYIPSHFEEARPEIIEKIITEHPLGTLIYQPRGLLDATHVPFVFQRQRGEHGTLVAHVARRNPIWQQVADGSDVLVIFSGVDSYISPNWYPTKQETHRHVPTWDYQVVHVHGKIRFIDDIKHLRASVALLTHQNETRTGEAKPWTLGDGEKEHIASLLQSIIGIEIAITTITGASKLSQNREPKDLDGVVEGLRKKGEHRTADAVLEARKA